MIIRTIFISLTVLLAKAAHAEMLTYWTCDGSVYPLTSEEVTSPTTPYNELQVVIPAEAAAVDLRGVSATNAIYTLNLSEANTNCLYYIDEADYVKNLPDHNVIINGVTSNLVLSDGYAYYCPEGFTAQYASFVFNTQTGSTSGTYYDTVALPFKADYIIPYDINGNETAGDDMIVLAKYDSDDGYYLYFNTTADLQLQPHTPYLLISAQGESRVLFIGNEQQIVPSCEIIATGTYYRFVGTTTGVAATGIYQINHEYPSFCKNEEDEAQIMPFRCYMIPAWNDEFGNIDVLEIQTDAFHHMSVHAPHARLSNADAVYTLTGQRISAGSQKKGICIVGGRKVIVK